MGFIALSFFGLFAAGIVGWGLLANISRGRRSKSTWVETTARIKWFGVSYGFAEVEYEYKAGVQLLTGTSIVPGPLSGEGKNLRAQKKVYLNSGGSLKFVPGSTARAYYDPRKPADAALVVGAPPWAGWNCVILFAICASLYALHWRTTWLEAHLGHLWSLGLLASGAGIFLYGTSCLRRHLATGSFLPISGRLLAAEVSYSGGSDGGGGYTSSALFDYNVGGTTYRSRQLTAIPAFVAKSKASVERDLARLRALPTLTLYYNPRAPWDAILQRGPLWSIFAALAMGLLFTGVGLYALGKMRL